MSAVRSRDLGGGPVKEEEGMNLLGCAVVAVREEEGENSHGEGGRRLVGQGDVSHVGGTVVMGWVRITHSCAHGS